MKKRRPKRKSPSKAQLRRELTAANDLVGVREEELQLCQTRCIEQSHDLAETRRRLEQTETLLSGSEERYTRLVDSAANHEERLQDDVRRLGEELLKTSRRLQDSKDANVSQGQAAAVLALHLVGQTRPAELLQSLEVAAADFGVSPELFDGFKWAVSEALNEAFFFYTSTQWPTQRAADSLISNMGADSALDMIDSVLSRLTGVNPSDKSRRSDVSRPASPAAPGMGGAAGG